MFGKILFLFVAIPLLEVLILIELGSRYGFWPTIFLVIGTGMVGAVLARIYGLSIWFEIQNDLSEGRMPTDKLTDGLLVLVGGIVLLTPGLITDIVGLLLLIPASRRPFKQWLIQKFSRMAESRETSFFISNDQF
jgi:UPF0716 protein FxsA